jgi:hypothetical protein
MQLRGVPSLRIEAERCPFTRLELRDSDIRRIKNPRAYIVARWLGGLYDGKKKPGQNYENTQLRLHTLPP